MLGLLLFLLVENLHKQHSNKDKQEYRSPSLLEKVFELRLGPQILERWQWNILRHHQLMLPIHMKEQTICLGLRLAKQLVVMSRGRDRIYEH